MGGRNYSLCSTVEEFEDSEYAVGNPELTARSGFLESLPVSPSSWHNRRNVVRGSHFQTTEHQAGSHGRRASRSAGAGPATSRIVPWPNIPKMTYATEIANTGASPGA